MKILKTVDEVRSQVKAWKKEGLSVGLVPTMGYLHEGHQSLIRKSVEQNDRTARYRVEPTGRSFTYEYRTGS